MISALRGDNMMRGGDNENDPVILEHDVKGNNESGDREQSWTEKNERENDRVALPSSDVILN